MLGVLASLPFLYPGFGAIFWIGLAVIAALIIYEHSIVKPNDLTRVNDAFFTVNSIVGIGLFAVGAIDAWF
jgi:4-hydroxybenzoate polyprenyltransferase